MTSDLKELCKILNKASLANLNVEEFVKEQTKNFEQIKIRSKEIKKFITMSYETFHRPFDL